MTTKEVMESEKATKSKSAKASVVVEPAVPMSR